MIFISSIGLIIGTDPHLKNFLSNTSMYSQWDDHEVIDDFGAQWSYWNAESKIEQDTKIL